MPGQTQIDVRFPAKSSRRGGSLVARDKSSVGNADRNGLDDIARQPLAAIGRKPERLAQKTRTATRSVKHACAAAMRVFLLPHRTFPDKTPGGLWTKRADDQFSQ